MAEYYRRVLFTQMLADNCTVEFAAEVALKVKRRRAQEVRAELHLAGGPREWLRRRTWEEMKRGKIGRGRETKPSENADAFYLQLAGGWEEIAWMKARMFGYRVAAELQKVLAAAPSDLDREMIDYLVHSNMLWGLRDDSESD